MSEKDVPGTGRDIVECLDALQQSLHILLGEVSCDMTKERIAEAVDSLQNAENKIIKLKLRFPK